MNLIDAIRSGRPFRRSKAWVYGNGSWLTYTPGAPLALWSTGDGRPYEFTACDVLGDDWEIQEPAVTVTRTQFWVAFQDALRVSSHDETYGVVLHVARKLGLED